MSNEKPYPDPTTSYREMVAGFMRRSYHLAFLAISTFSFLVVIIYTSVIIHTHMVEFALFSDPALQSAIDSSPMWAYYLSTAIFAVWSIASFIEYMRRR